MSSRAARNMRQFLREADEIVRALQGNLVLLHDAASDPRILDDTFRMVHTLKGIAEDYELPPEATNNIFEMTEEFYCHNGRHGTREDVVFLINGIPVLVVECKNATKDEAIALGIDQIRRYHIETPELFVPQMVFTATEALGAAWAVWTASPMPRAQLDARLDGTLTGRH